MTSEIGAAGDSILDLEQLRANLGGADDATLAEISAFFVTSFEPLLRDILQHAAVRSVTDLTRVAHAAKGAARNVCAPTLGDQLANLESAARSADWAEVDRLRPLVSDSFRCVAERIAAAQGNGAR